VSFRLFAVLFFGIIIDQLTKYYFAWRDFFVGFIHIHLLKNYGLGFSLNFGLIINVLLIIAAIVIFTYYFFKTKIFGFLEYVSFGLILAGASSNIIDRLVFGYVRDFIDVRLGFTFNLADVFVVVGLITFLFIQPKQKT